MWSRIAFWICALLMLGTAFFYYPKWKMTGTEATLSWDVSGYYLYLPALFIYGDLHRAAFLEKAVEQYNPAPGNDQVMEHPSGARVMKYASGQALQFLPWFLVAHLLAEPLGYPADGFSYPYQAAISWGGLLVALLGLWVMRKNLLYYFSDKVSAIALLVLVLGSNYFDYTAIDGALTHNWLFTATSLLVYATIHFYRRPRFGVALGIGVLLGWMMLTRPTELVAVVIPLLWGAMPGKERLRFFGIHWQKLVVAAVAAGLIGSIQLIYWKWATGSWLVYSYGDQSFSWLQPHVLNVLISYRSGWLVYSPAMLLGVLGLFWIWKYRELRWAVVVFCIVQFYITSAWDIWWYGGSFGQRALIQAYPVWLFAVAALINRALQRKWSIAVLVLFLAITFWCNLWWTHQAHRGGKLFVSQMTKAYFWKVIGKGELQRDWLKYLDSNDLYWGEPKDIQLIYQNDFEQDTVGVTTDAPISGQKSLFLNPEKEYTPVYEFQAPDNSRWVRVTSTFRCREMDYEPWKMTQCVVAFFDGEKQIKARAVRLHRLVTTSDPYTLVMEVKLPRKAYNRAVVYFWNVEKSKTVWIDDLKIEGFR